MAYFQTKNISWGTFWRALKRRYWYILCHLEYFKAIWYDLSTFGNFIAFWYIFARLGNLYREKSGNRGWQRCLIIGRVECGARIADEKKRFLKKTNSRCKFN
jgi:hypothetical protein